MIRYTLGLGEGLKLALAAESRRGPQYGQDGEILNLGSVQSAG
jgi:hypothetical protein